jgi:hypothetical protein
MKSDHTSPAVSFLVRHLRELLDSYEGDLHKLSLRQRVVRLIDLQNSLRKLGKAVVSEGRIGGSSARERLRGYFVGHAGEVIDGEELAVISGISEYARRVRELREKGMEILTGPDVDPATGHPLRPDQYLFNKKLEKHG